MTTRPKSWLNAWWIPLALFGTSFLLRLFRVESSRQWIEDTVFGGPAANLYSLHGFIGPGPWTSQPGGSLLRYPFGLLFGNDLIGWRMANVLFGALTVVVVYFIARRLFRNYWVGLAAGLLMALEPFSILMSRSTDEDVIAAFFAALAILCALRFLDKELESDLALTAIALSAAVAIRYYMALEWFVVVGVLVWNRRRELRVWGIRFVAYFVLLPPAATLLANLPWLARGHSLGEWVQLQADLLRTFSSAEHPGLRDLQRPMRWILGFPHKTIVAPAGKGSAAMSVTMSNPVVWWLMTPGALVSAWSAVRSRDARRALVAGGFFAPLVFFLLVPRDVMLYSALSILPLGMVFVAGLLSLLRGRRRTVALAVLLVCCVYLYPVVSFLKVPLWPYLWLAGGS